MYVLSITADQYGEKLGFLDSLTFGGQILLIGMLAVFAVLGIIWAILSVFKFVFASVPNTPKKEISKIPEQQPAVVYTAPAETEIVAVITAAIAMAEAESGNNVKFRVVSFKRI